MRALWLTDIHLNFLQRDEVDRFLDRVARQSADVILMTGDYGESHDVCGFLRQMADAWSSPIYFVLGNHDFYHGSIAEVRRAVAALADTQPNLKYLTIGGVASLTDRVGVVGHDGWADGRIGDYERSMVMMNDYRLIAELAPFSKRDRLEQLHAMGDAAAEHVRRVLPQALARYEEVFLLTHVPPMREACWHEGKISDDEWAPHFTCQALGDTLLEIMADHADRSLTVLCGHTHGRGETRPLPNVRILTGAAKYGEPDIEQIINIF